MEEIEEQSSNMENFSPQNVELKPIAFLIARLLRKYRLSYDQTKYVFKMARQNAEVSQEKRPSKITQPLSSKEIERLIQAGYEKNPKYGLMVKIMGFTGVRVSELVNIKIGDIQFENNMILVTGKGNKERFVPLYVSLKQEIMTYLGNRDKGYLFENNKFDKYTIQMIHHVVKNLGVDAKIGRRVYPHLLRHSIATFLINKGMPIDKLQLMLGHSDPKTTEIYAKINPYAMLEQYNKALIYEGVAEPG